MKKIILLFFFVAGVLPASAKTDKFGTWFELEFTKKFFKRFEFSIIPEIRLQDDFTVDKYQFDGQLSYEPFKFLEFSTAYRIRTNVKKKEDVITHRWVFNTTLKTDIGRFRPSFRTRITYLNDKEENKKVTIIRPRIKLVYDISGNKLTPFVSYEVFHNLAKKGYMKGRLDVGVSRKMGKYHRVAIFYRLQDYYSDKTSIHILGIDYRFKI
jgi:hypothetical protein